MDWVKVYRDLCRRSWIILLLLAIGSFFVMSLTVTMGVVLGGLIVIVNFDILQNTIKRAFPTKGAVKSKKAILVAKSYVRLLALGAVIYLLIKIGIVDPIGLTIGLSTIVISIVSFGISSALKMRTREAT